MLEYSKKAGGCIEYMQLGLIAVKIAVLCGGGGYRWALEAVLGGVTYACIIVPHL